MTSNPWNIIAALMTFCVTATGTAIAQNTPLGAATNAIGTLTIVRTDGVQQRLVALRFDLQRIRDALEDERDTILMQAEQDLEATLEDLRELSHGLHPPLLSRNGLGPTLQALARRLPIPVHENRPCVSHAPDRRLRD